MKTKVQNWTCRPSDCDGKPKTEILQMIDWMQQNGILSRAIKYIRESNTIKKSVELALQDAFTFTEEMVEHKTERSKKVYEAMLENVYNEIKEN